MHDDVTLPLDETPRGQTDMPDPRDVWGSFRLITRVGVGGFGEVYRAWDPNLEREVALKLLLPGVAGASQSEAEYKAMLREARALASVRHPNIVPVYGIDRHDGRVGFWTDFVKGKTLSVLLGSQGPFGYREATLIALDVTRALSAVHRAGILHRDIKAENVMREEGGRILLMDFGLSVLPLGQTNTAGTPNYMAPELWQGQPATVQSDIYAMGVLLFYLVTGEHPVKLGGLSAIEALAALPKRKQLMDLRSDLPESFLRTVSIATETDPARRYASAGQLAAALSECLGTAGPAETIPLAAGPAKKRPLLVGAGIAALVIGIAAFKTPAVRRILHLDREPAAADVSTNQYDQYLHAKELLQKSYKDANVAEAVNEFQQLFKDDPNFALAEAGLGAAYFKQYRNSNDGTLLDKAKVETEKALAKDPDLSPAYVTKAQIEANAGADHAVVALQLANKAISLDKTSAEAYAAQGKAFEALGRMPDAIEAIKKAIDLAPDNSMWLLRLGSYYKSSGKLEEARATWQKAVESDSQNTFAYYDLGTVNTRLDKLADARQNLQSVLKIGPDEDSYRALGTVYQLEGKYSDAAAMDNQAIKLDPDDYQAWANLGSVYAWSGDKHEQSLEAYNKAIKLAEDRRSKTPDSVDLLIGLANLYASVGNETKSVPMIRKALALAPDNPGVNYLAGYSYELLKQREQAISLIAKSLAQGGPNNEEQRSPELASLRNDPRFIAALAQAKTEFAVDNKKKLN